MATGHRIIQPGMPAGKVGLSDTHGLRFQLTQGPVFPGGSDSKESACNAGDLGLIPGLGRSPGEGNGNPLQYSCLGKSRGRRSPEGYSPWGHKESDMTERLSLHLCAGG